MITITLDEQGHFETPDCDSEPMFIGGLLYDDRGNQQDYENELSRIIQYLRRVCAQSGSRFPQDLHVECGNTNSYAVKQVKTELSDTLSEFLRTGTYHGEECLVPGPGGSRSRKGNYFIFVMLKSKEGKKTLLNNRVSELVRDDYASNLYLHMAEDVVERLVFHNPLLRVTGSLHLELATRCVVFNPNNPADEARKLDYIRLGYKLKDGATGSYVQLTNDYIYRTALEREMLDSGREDIQIDRIGVKSIYYGVQENDRDYEKMAFLFLADVICSKLGFAPEGKSPRAWMECLQKRTAELMPGRTPLLFGYDIVDTYFDRAIRAAEAKQYYAALEAVYTGMHTESDFAQLYRTVWFPELLKRLERENNAEAIAQATERLKNVCHSDNLQQEKALFLFQNLEKMAQSMPLSGPRSAVIFFELFDVGVSVYCHVGDSRRALECYEKCKEWSSYVPVERFLTLRNKMTVCLNDLFRYRDGVKMAEETLIYQAYVQDLRAQIFGPENSGTLEHAKAKSQMGQEYAHLRQACAQEMFREALSEMEPDTPNYRITQSYLLQHLLDMEMRKEYEREAFLYFGGTADLREQFLYLVQNGAGPAAKFSLNFALYVYVRALYTFYRKDMTAKLQGMLFDIEITLRNLHPEAGELINGHPWEIIYKYLALLALDAGKRQIADRYMERSEKILTVCGSTIDVIIRFGRLQYDRAIGNSAWKSEAQSLWETVCRMQDRCDAIPGITDPEAQFEALDQILVFMYR